MQTGDRAARDENTRRKQHRIVQVREQSKEIAAKIRKRINEERERQKDHVEKVKIDELRKWRDNRVSEQQYNYDRIIGSTLDANEEAKREMEANFRQDQRKQELDLIAAQRGRLALRKEINENRPKPHPAANRKPKSRSTEVQTDDVAFLRVEDSDLPSAESLPRSSSLAPESVKRDEIISDRSVDILEKSKQFVADANRRLDEISAKVAQCQAMDQQEEQYVRVDEPAPVPVVKKAEAFAQKPILRTNNTTRLRVEMNQRKPAVVPPKIVNRPKKVIPSAKEPVAAPPVASRGSVVCYDHPNRFTKTYDIPKNIVVRSTLAGHEDDAVTNALNETLTNIEQDNSKITRAKELRQKEAVRELEAIEKSQVRRDYEMLAKTLDEVRKARNSSPVSTTFAGHQWITDSVQHERKESSKNIPLSNALNDVLHMPIRISCPKVQPTKGSQGRLNVGDADTDRDDFSASDSAQSILLDQLANIRDGNIKENTPQVVVENNVPGISVHAVRDAGKGRSSREPVKIIIQLEGLKSALSQPPPSAVMPFKSGLQYGTVNESLSTNYMSPPSEIVTQMDKYLKPKNTQSIKPAKKSTEARGKSHANANLKSYITKLLQMPQKEVDKLSDNDVSDLPTPTNSILNVPSNVPQPPKEVIYDEKKLDSVSRIIEDNYSILEEVDELIAQNSRSSQGKGTTTRTDTMPSTDSIMHRYATMSQTYNDRIHSLTKMIKVIRAEKQTLMQDNGLSNITTSERDTSTKYKDFGSMARTITPSGSDLSNDSGEILSGSHQIKKKAVDKPVRLGANKIIGLSRDSGISMSRPVTSTEVRENPEERPFEPMLKDIPRQKPLETKEITPAAATADLEKKRPPNSITRYSPEAIQAAGHDLSTILEVDTPGTVNAGGGGGGGQDSSLPGELKKFPTIEEFVTQNGTNVSEVESEVVVPVKPFVSFQHFVGANGVEDDGTISNELELNLSEIAEELRRRSLLPSDGQQGVSDEDDEKKYIRSLSRELEEMILRINSQALKEPNGSLVSAGSFKSILSDSGPGVDTSIGKLLDKIQPSRFPTREEFNMQNNSKHYKSSEVLKSFLDVENDETRKSPQKQQTSHHSREPSIARGSKQSAVQSMASGTSRKSSDSVKSQTLNLSDDFMNALEKNLSEMGLKWAVNMLKRSHVHISSSTSQGSTSENESKDPIPFESKTMSLLTDLEKSSISDESKTSNIKNIILRELIRNNQSANSSSDGSLSCGNLGRRLLNSDANGTGSEDGRCLRTSTPVHSNVYNSISTSSTVVDKGEKTLTGVDMTDCLFSNESKLSSVQGDVATLSNYRLNVPESRLDVGRFARPTDSTLSTEYSLNEHNKRKMTRRLDK